MLIDDQEMRRNVMPSRDGTGPAGQGPRTGRGLGNCELSLKSNANPIANWRRPGRQRPRAGFANWFRFVR